MQIRFNQQGDLDGKVCWVYIIYIHIFVGTMKNGSVISKFSGLDVILGYFHGVYSLD